MNKTVHVKKYNERKYQTVQEKVQVDIADESQIGISDNKKA